MAWIESRKKQQGGGGGNERFDVVLSVPSSQGTDKVQTAYTYLSDINGKLSAVVTGITDCGGNEAYISLEVNGVEKSRGTLITDTSTVVSFSNIPVSIGDIVDIKFGWVRLHGCKYDGTAEIIIISGGGIVFPKFSETTIATGTSGGVLTFTDDYHNYDFIDIVCRNSDTNKQTDLITTPSALDSVFDISGQGIVLNECANNQYGTYYVTNSTTWTRNGARNLYAEEVIGLNCSGTVTETEIYNKGSYGTSSVTVTGTDLLSYDMFIVMSSTDGIQPNSINVSKGIIPVTSQSEFYAVITPYNSSYTVTISDTEMSSSYYHYVSGIKFT